MRLLIYPEYLFYFLLKKYSPDIVCDIGSRDGRESLKFRSILSKSEIIAFEANPSNYAMMIKDDRLINNSVKIINQAVSDKDGTIDFYKIDTDEAWKSGASSIFARSDDSDNEKIQVPVTRLDDYFSSLAGNKTISMWIDVEGAAFQVINGATDTLKNTMFAHVEVETDYIWKDQKLKKDVDELMNKCGLVEVVRPWNSNRKKQFDVLYMKRDLFKKRIISNIYVVTLAVLLSFLRKILPKAVKYRKINLIPRTEALMSRLI